MRTNPDPHVRRWRAAARIHHRCLTGIVLYVLQKKGEPAATEMMFRMFRAQHEEKFLAGIEALGLEGLPDAVAAAQYIYLSNHAGGVAVQYMDESDRKAWVRYPPPRWIWDGTALCAVPTETNLGMVRGFHAHCGVSLGNPRLGFVCTGISTDGHPGLEGYFEDGGRELAPDDRLRFALDEEGPDFDPAKAPALDWPEERFEKARRNYAVQYLRTLLPVMCGLFDEAEAGRLGRQATRLVGLHAYGETAGLLGGVEAGAHGFAAYMAGALVGAGDEADWRAEGDGAVVRRAGWRLTEGKEGTPPAVFEAWNGFWEGALAAHDRRLELILEARMDRGDGAWSWRIQPRRSG